MDLTARNNNERTNIQRNGICLRWFGGDSAIEFGKFLLGQANWESVVSTGQENWANFVSTAGNSWNTFVNNAATDWNGFLEQAAS